MAGGASARLANSMTQRTTLQDITTGCIMASVAVQTRMNLAGAGEGRGISPNMMTADAERL